MKGIRIIAVNTSYERQSAHCFIVTEWMNYYLSKITEKSSLMWEKLYWKLKSLPDLQGYKTFGSKTVVFPYFALLSRKKKGKSEQWQLKMFVHIWWQSVKITFHNVQIAVLKK